MFYKYIFSSLWSLTENISDIVWVSMLNYVTWQTHLTLLIYFLMLPRQMIFAWFLWDHVILVHCDTKMGNLNTKGDTLNKRCHFTKAYITFHSHSGRLAISYLSLSKELFSDMWQTFSNKILDPNHSGFRSGCLTGWLHCLWLYVTVCDAA